MKKYIFTDTNLYEHFLPLSNIDWLALAECDAAVLVVPANTISELTKHKDTSTRARLKKRAAEALSRLSSYAAASKPVEVRTAVDVEFRHRGPLWISRTSD